MHSLNGFKGRQTWEYEEQAGDLAERAAVDKARADFTQHRHEQRHSADLLMRYQVCYVTTQFLTQELEYHTFIPHATLLATMHIIPGRYVEQIQHGLGWVSWLSLDRKRRMQETSKRSM